MTLLRPCLGEPAVTVHVCIQEIIPVKTSSRRAKVERPAKEPEEPEEEVPMKKDPEEKKEVKEKEIKKECKKDKKEDARDLKDKKEPKDKKETKPVEPTHKKEEVKEEKVSGFLTGRDLESDGIQHLHLPTDRPRLLCMSV